MPLPNLLNIPRTKQDWDSWGFAHRDHTKQIQQAIQKQSNGADRLFEYELDPIPSDQITEWLSRNQQSHDDFNEILGIQGTDLEGVDFKDIKQLTNWMLIHYQEHFNAAQALNI